MTLYMKRGKKYVPVKEFTGFPTEGIWWVERKPGKHESRWIAKLADLPVQNHLVKLDHYRYQISQAIMRVQNRRAYSVSDLIDEILLEVAKKQHDEEGKEHEDQVRRFGPRGW